MTAADKLLKQLTAQGLMQSMLLNYTKWVKLLISFWVRSLRVAITLYEQVSLYHDCLRLRFWIWHQLQKPDEMKMRYSSFLLRRPGNYTGLVRGKYMRVVIHLSRSKQFLRTATKSNKQARSLGRPLDSKCSLCCVGAMYSLCQMEIVVNTWAPYHFCNAVITKRKAVLVPFSEKWRCN